MSAIQNNYNSENIRIADRVDHVTINNIPEKKDTKLIIYILGYLLIYMIGGILFLLGMAIYSTKIISSGSAINQNAIMQAIEADHSLPMWDIAFVVFGFVVVLSAATLHWFVKK